MSLKISQNQDSAVLKEKSFPTKPSSKVYGDEEPARNSLGPRPRRLTMPRIGQFSLIANEI